MAVTAEARAKGTQAMMRKAADRRDAIIEFMIGSDGNPISSKDLGKMFDCSEETVRRDFVNFIMPNNSQIVAVPRHGYAYSKLEEKKAERLNIFKNEPVMEEKAPLVEKQSNPMKNHEGYVDPTAGKAIEAVDGPEEGPAFAMAGDVWDCACSDGSSQRFLIFASFEKFSIGMVLNPTRSGGVPKKFQRKITAGLDTRFTDIRRITTKPNKYMTQKVGHLGGEVYDSILKDAVGVFASFDSNAVADPDMWNALNAREKDLNKREDHLDERAKEIAKQQMEADRIMFTANEVKHELDQRAQQLDNLSTDLSVRNYDLDAYNERIKEAENMVTKKTAELDNWEQALADKEEALNERALDSAANQTSDLELALLKQKVEIYEKLIFGERRISI